jgi:Fur family transcriptional regulator, iron response regulator
VRECRTGLVLIPIAAVYISKRRVQGGRVWRVCTLVLNGGPWIAMSHQFPGTDRLVVRSTAPVIARLRSAGLRPTRQRVSLAGLLFGQGDRHISAEELHEDAARVGIRVSLATIYNTLHQFKQAGLLRELAIDGQRSYFDTNTSNHNHFYIEHKGQLIDIPGHSVRVDGLPEPPEGMRVSHIDVVVRLVKA